MYFNPIEDLKDKDVNATVLIDPDHEHLPDFMMAVTAKMVKNAMEVNTYDKYDFADMVIKCNHINEGNQQQILGIFEHTNLYFMESWLHTGNNNLPILSFMANIINSKLEPQI